MIYWLYHFGGCNHERPAVRMIRNEGQGWRNHYWRTIVGGTIVGGTIVGGTITSGLSAMR